MKFGIRSIVAFTFFGVFAGGGVTAMSQTKPAGAPAQETAYDRILTYQAEKPSGVQIYVLDDVVTQCQYLVVKTAAGATLEPRLGKDGYPLCVQAHHGLNDDQLVLQAGLIQQHLSRIGR